MAKNHKTSNGKSFPIGPSKTKDGVNFCVYSHHAKRVELHFFNHKNDAEPSQTFLLNAEDNLTYVYWHIEIEHVKEGQLYGYKVIGDGTDGDCLDEKKLLIDPYTRATATSDFYSRKKASIPGNNTKYAIKSIWVDNESYDWEEDEPLKHDYFKTVIYEVHVGGFTKNKNSGVSAKLRGTYIGMIEKIPYLQKLGITAVELLPVHQFDETDAPGGLNYWGYSPVAFFAPHSGYATNPDDGSVVNEFKDMVKAFHKAGIEVFLDVVFNHTAEAGLGKAIQSFKGFGNKTYYLMDEDGKSYSDYSGCGNAINANHSVVRRLILDCLHYWVTELHIDGFRFDLASVLARDTDGSPLENPPLLWEIEADPFLAGTKIIAEAWDAGGLYQVGSFIGYRWGEWNGKFRDDVRRFMKGDKGMVKDFSTRLMGSPDIYYSDKKTPYKSVNFVTCHDGFTLNDLVSYNDKHNLANKENNNDGGNDNFSWNGGIEGKTDDIAIEKLRLKQIKNFFVTTLLSIGTPMFWMGDEVRRTQNGNNNAYCQDNELSWFDWDLVEENKDLYDFVSQLIKMKKQQGTNWDNYSMIGYHDNFDWHGVSLNEPDVGENSHSLSFTFTNEEADVSYYFMFNSYWEALDFELPEPLEDTWYKRIDTDADFPNDCHLNTKMPKIKGTHIKVAPRSIVILRSGSVG